MRGKKWLPAYLKATSAGGGKLRACGRESAGAGGSLGGKIHRRVITIRAAGP